MKRNQDVGLDEFNGYTGTRYYIPFPHIVQNVLLERQYQYLIPTYIRLADYYDPSNYLKGVFPSQKTIGEKIGKRREIVNQHIQALETLYCSDGLPLLLKKSETLDIDKKRNRYRLPHIEASFQQSNKMISDLKKNKDM